MSTLIMGSSLQNMSALGGSSISEALYLCGHARRYPGHKSYSLGNLCELYDIDLRDHHRALADARAAAQLLNLINEKRDIRGDAVLGRVEAAADA